MALLVVEENSLVARAVDLDGGPGYRQLFEDAIPEVEAAEVDLGVVVEPALAEEPDRGYFVYKLFGANDRLLYVGMSRRLRSRLRQHYAERAGYVIRHEVIVCSSEREMVELEAELIRTLHPPLNDIGNGES